MSVTVETVSGRLTVQGPGRIGFGALGVGRGGPADRRAAALANRLVGNAEAAPLFELTLGSMTLTTTTPAVVCVVGPTAGQWVGRAPVDAHRAQHLQPGERLHVAPASSAVRSWLAVRGGLVSTSRFSDPVIRAGDRVEVGNDTAGPVPAQDIAGAAGGEHHRRLAVIAGPRLDWFEDMAWATLLGTNWTVRPHSDRVGIRLDGPPLRRARREELRSEGLIRGSIQVPADGRPVICFADHPTTGGYPVVAVVADDEVDRLAQALPGSTVSFVARPQPWR